MANLVRMKYVQNKIFRLKIEAKLLLHIFACSLFLIQYGKSHLEWKSHQEKCLRSAISKSGSKITHKI